MFMKTQIPSVRGRSVAARAVPDSKAVQSKTAAVLVGAALQVALLAQPATAALASPQQAVEATVNKVENLLDGAENEVKKATEGSYVASAPKAVEEAKQRAEQERMKKGEPSDAIGAAGGAAQKMANDLSSKAADAKAAAEEATAARAQAVKDAAGKFGPDKLEAQKLVSQKESAEDAALKKAADAKSAAENAVADAVAYATPPSN